MICKRCGQNKPLDAFHNSKQTKTGKFPWCKDCKSEHRRERYLANRDKELERRAQWGLENYEHRTVYERERSVRYYAENKERVRAIKKRYKAKRRALLEDAGSHTFEEWWELCNYYDNRCIACGKEEITEDHVVPLTKGGSDTIDNLQPLCQSCNSSKGTKTIDYRISYEKDNGSR